MRNCGSSESRIGSVTRAADCFRCSTLPCTGVGGTRGVRVAASSVAFCRAERPAMSRPMEGRNPVSEGGAHSLSDDNTVSTSSVGLDLGARFFRCRVFAGGGGGSSSLLLLLLLLLSLYTSFFFMRFLESEAVSLLDDDGVCWEHARARASVGKARNFFASLRELNFLWCRLCPSVSSLHLDHSVVRGAFPPSFALRNKQPCRRCPMITSCV